VHRRGPKLPRHALLLAALAAALVACAPRTEVRTVEAIGTTLAVEFELVPGQTSIERFDPPGAGGRLELTVGTLARNPNEFGVRLQNVTYVVYLEGKSVVRGALAPDIYLESGATAPLRFDISTSLAGQADLLKAAARAFADRPLQFRVEGTLRFATATHVYETRNKVLVSGATLARQTVQAPLLRLTEAESRIFMLRPDVPVVQLVLQAVNPGDIGYFLYGKDLALTLGNWPMATEDMSPVPLAAGQSSRIDILFYPNLKELPDEARLSLEATLAGYTTLVRLEGELFMDVLGVDSFPVPGGWSVTGFVR
jgi:hypothetical protein